MADYVDRYVAFIDILGFREHVKSLDKDPAKLDRLLNILKEIATDYPNMSRKMSATQGFEQMLRVTAFSDNIVISGEHNVIGLAVVLAVSASLCSRLLSQGVYARGGITLGKLYHSDSVVLGDGLIKAYELESKTAQYPRIIVDPTIAVEVRATSVPGVWSLKQDFDGLFFLDYLEFRGIPSNSESQDEHFLTAVRQEIIATLSSNKDLSIKSKAGWLARHLNERAEYLKMEPIPLE